MNSGFPPLSPRLAAVADAIAPGSRVADLGTDHGKLPLWLAATGRAAFCMATEKDAAMLARVARAPEEAAWGSRLDYRAGDGLAAIRPEDRIDTIVLAGLGGRSIHRILAAPAAKLPELARLVLQPRSEPNLARAWLSQQGWRLVAERLVRDRGRFHATLVAERGADADLYVHPALSRDDLLAAGPLLVRSGTPEVERFWRDEQERLRGILKRGRSGPSIARARAGVGRCERVLEAISRRV